jgi:hypothetical protein
MDYQGRKSAWVKTGQLLVVVAFGFLIGILSVNFRGGALAWSAITLGAVAVVLNLFLLVRDFWKRSER